jgi:hypothetical protein
MNFANKENLKHFYAREKKLKILRAFTPHRNALDCNVVVRSLIIKILAAFQLSPSLPLLLTRQPAHSCDLLNIE